MPKARAMQAKERNLRTPLPSPSWAINKPLNWQNTSQPLATILHCLGIDRGRLTFHHQGLDFRLSGVEPSRVVKEILA
jgi:hypothetical protein